MKYIAPYITRAEYACRHCDGLPPTLEERAYIYEVFFGRFAEIREKWNRPLRISSGYRCTEHQLTLYRQKKSATPYSVHIFGLALDIDVDTRNEVLSLVDVAEEIDPDMRIGYQDYLNKGQTFVHIDMGYFIGPSYDKKLCEGARW